MEKEGKGRRRKEIRVGEGNERWRKEGERIMGSEGKKGNSLTFRREERTYL